MEVFGVSRTPIREAMQSLSLLGIVEISPRRGATVQALPVELVVDFAILSGSMAPDRSLNDLFEFRYTMESAIAALAAINATAEQLDSIRAVLAENAAAVERGDREALRHVDVRFHAAIAEASGNVVFEAVARALSGLLVEQRRIIGGIPGASEASFAEHGEILAAISGRGSAAARKAAQSHIEQTRNRYRSARGDRLRSHRGTRGATD